MMSPGEHTLTLVSTRYGYRAELPIEVKPGEVTAYTASMPTGRVVVNTTAGAEVWIEGQKLWRGAARRAGGPGRVTRDSGEP